MKADGKQTTGTESLDTKVGRAIKSLRLLEHLTLADLSQRSGVSVPMISKIERGQVSASLSTLDAIAQAVGVPVANFFADTIEKSEVSFVRSGEGVHVRRQGSTYGHSYQLIGRVSPSHMEFEPFLITIDETATGQPLFQHPGVEFIHVLEGRMTYRCGSETYVLAPGDSLTFETVSPHGPIIVDEPPVSFLTVIARTA